MKVVPTSNIDQIAEFPLSGITLTGIKEFVNSIGGEEVLSGLTTTEVCEKFVIDITKDDKISYCNWLQKKGDVDRHIGQATVFVSHAWRYLFLDVLRALEAIPTHLLEEYRKGSDGSERTIYFWFDLFSNNQNGLQDPPPFEWWCGTFMNAIATIHHVIMVICPWDNPIPLHRAWCLWEVYCAVKTKSTFNLIMSPSESERFHAMILDEIDNFYNMLGNLDLKNSQAFNPLDRARIFEVIEKTVGFGQLNTIVVSAVTNWLLTDYHNLYRRLSQLTAADREDIESGRLQALPYEKCKIAMIYTDLLFKSKQYVPALNVYHYLVRDLQRFPQQDRFLAAQREIIMADGVNSLILRTVLKQNRYYLRRWLHNFTCYLLKANGHPKAGFHLASGDEGYQYCQTAYSEQIEFLRMNLFLKLTFHRLYRDNPEGRAQLLAMDHTKEYYEATRWFNWYLRALLGAARLALKDSYASIDPFTHCVLECEKYAGGESLALAEAKMLLGDYHIAHYHPTEALTLYLEAQTIYNKICSRENPKVLSVLGKIGRAYCLLDDYEKAMEYLQDAYDRERERFGGRGGEGFQALLECKVYRFHVREVFSFQLWAEMHQSYNFFQVYWIKYRKFPWYRQLYCLLNPFLVNLGLTIALGLITTIMVSFFLFLELFTVVMVRTAALCRIPLKYRLILRYSLAALFGMVRSVVLPVYLCAVGPLGVILGINWGCSDADLAMTQF